MKVFMFILVFFGDGGDKNYRVEYPTIDDCHYAIENSKSNYESDASVVMYCTKGKVETTNPYTGNWTEL